MTDPWTFDGELIKDGFWKSDGRASPYEPGRDLFLNVIHLAGHALADAYLPSVFDCIDTEWDPKERELVTKYVADERFRGESYLGDSTCRICGKRNGSADFADGRFVWPEGLAHYVTEHQVRPPPAFVRHVLRKVSR